VIKKAAPVAFLMTLSVSAVCLCWANDYTWWQWVMVFGIFMAIIAIIGTLLYFHKDKEES